MSITKAFLAGARECPEFQEAIDVVRQNSIGNFWLVGGFVYRTLAHKMYGAPKPVVDLDFVVETPVKRPFLPCGWTMGINGFGNPKFVNGGRSIDYVPLEKVFSIRHRRLKPTMANFFSGVPLNVQSIAYDVNANQVIGETGIDGVVGQYVAVYDLFFAEYAAKKKRKTVEQMLREKAESLGFRAVC